MKLGGTIRVVLAACLLSLAWTPATQAQPRPSEYDVKAAYLSKFAPFIAWPSTVFAGDDASFQICIVGRDPFGEALDRAMAGQTFGTHPILVRRLPKVGPGSGCHVVFAGGSKEQPAADVLRAVAGTPVLTVTDDAIGPTRGMVHFVLRDARIRFHIDAGACARGGLKPSSKLLALALSVKA